MKNKKTTYIAMSVLIAFLLTVSWSIVAFTNNSTETQSLSFKGKANKETFLLGEPVKVEFEFINEGETAVQIPGGGVMAGNIEIFIAKKGESYRKYFRSDWGRVDGEVNVVTLAPNQNHKIDNTNATILWNGKPNYSHLNPDAAKRADKQDNKILTDYAFPDAGTYLVKAISCLIDELKGCSIPIESEPIEIKVNEPVGDDLEVWNQIKGNKKIAYLMQNSTFNTSEEAEKERLSNQVEQIIERYPNSVYSSYLKPNLEKSRARETKRDEFYKNIKPSQKPE